MSTRELQLQGDIRQAIENYLGDQVSGPWEAVIRETAWAIIRGSLPTASAALIDLALASTREDVHSQPDECICQRGLTGAEGMRW